MHTHQKRKHPVCLAGLIATTLAASAAVLPLATPPSSDFVDTESSTNIPLQAWRDYTPPVKLTMELNGTTTNAVQVAFGHDLNGDADLQPEETEYVIGFDCGEWVERVENVERVERVENVSRVSHEFNFRLAKDPAERWDLAKVTTRGKGDAAASITATLTPPHFYLIIR